MEFYFQHIHTNACFCFPENITSLQMCRVHGIHNMCCFAKFGIAIGGFSSKQKSPNSGIGRIFCKLFYKAPNFGAFLSKNVYWWVGYLAKNWYRESQIFEVRQPHPRTILAKVTHLGMCLYLDPCWKAELLSDFFLQNKMVILLLIIRHVQTAFQFNQL